MQENKEIKMEYKDGREEKKEQTLEEAFGTLDEIVTKLESGKLSLEDSFSMYQSGMELLKACSEKVDLVEKKVMQMDAEGGLREF